MRWRRPEFQKNTSPPPATASPAMRMDHDPPTASNTSNATDLCSISSAACHFSSVCMAGSA